MKNLLDRHPDKMKVFKKARQIGTLAAMRKFVESCGGKWLDAPYRAKKPGKN